MSYKDYLKTFLPKNTTNEEIDFICQGEGITPETTIYPPQKGDKAFIVGYVETDTEDSIALDIRDQADVLDTLVYNRKLKKLP